jgi:hypothetical protein
MSKEADWCRGPMANELNKIGIWLPFPNVSYMLGAAASGGRPDGEYRSLDGRVIDVEFKAASGSVFLGDPSDEANTEGFHLSQRRWHEKVSTRSKVPYAIVLYAYAGDKEKRRNLKEGSFYVVAPADWYAMEEINQQVNPDKIKRTVAVARGGDRLLAYRHISIEEYWSQYRYPTAADAAREVHQRCTRGY